MYQPKYSITNNILKSIGAIEAAKEVIENAPLVPSYEKQFKSDAMTRTIHHGTSIEGNDLSLDQTQKIIDGESVVAGERDIQEVINYRNVVKFLDELLEDSSTYKIDDLKRIHTLTVSRLVPETKMGVFRTSQVVIKEGSTGRVVLKPPPSLEVPYLLEDFFVWLNSPEGKQVHPVIKAGITHYVLVSIHPFVEGNGRTIRAFATLVLLREGYDIKRFFALEEHFDRDIARYYEALAKVDSNNPAILERDLTVWLEYFTEVVAIELNKIKEKVRKLSIDSRVRVNIGQQVALSERQMKIVEYMSDQGRAVMSELKDVVPMVSEDTILRDLRQLMEKGVIKKLGSTKASTYILISSGGVRSYEI